MYTAESYDRWFYAFNSSSTMTPVAHNAATCGRFEKSRVKLGSGGCASVWLGRDMDTMQLVALKRRFVTSRAVSSIGNLSHSNFKRSVDGPSSIIVEGSTADERKRTCTERARVGRAHCNSNNSSLVDGGNCSAGNDAVNCDVERDDDEHVLLHIASPHPNIIALLGWRQVHNNTYTALELMSSDLSQELKKSSVLCERTIQFVLFHVLSALAHVHSRSMAHRDVKPSNILLKPNVLLQPLGVHVVLGDFGSAHRVAHTSSKKKVNMMNFRGTRCYQPPELLLARSDDPMACDMWAVGCTMYELAVGAAPFGGDSALQMLSTLHRLMGTDFATFPAQCTTAEPPLFRAVADVLSDKGRELLAQLLQLDAMHRIKSSCAVMHPYFDDVRAYYAALTEPSADGFYKRPSSSRATIEENLLVSRPMRIVDDTTLTFKPLSDYDIEGTSEHSGKYVERSSMRSSVHYSQQRTLSREGGVNQENNRGGIGYSGGARCVALAVAFTSDKKDDEISHPNCGQTNHVVSTFGNLRTNALYLQQPTQIKLLSSSEQQSPVPAARKLLCFDSP